MIQEVPQANPDPLMGQAPAPSDAISHQTMMKKGGVAPAVGGVVESQGTVLPDGWKRANCDDFPYSTVTHEMVREGVFRDLRTGELIIDSEHIHRISSPEIVYDNAIRGTTIPCGPCDQVLPREIVQDHVQGHVQDEVVMTHEKA